MPIRCDVSFIDPGDKGNINPRSREILPVDTL